MRPTDPQSPVPLMRITIQLIAILTTVLTLLMADETTPLLDDDDASSWDPHAQFCRLIGTAPPDKHPHHLGDRSLYRRATQKRKAQNITYGLTASLSNTLLLSQVVLGATLTALGASESSHVLITIFGVLNTIIAGLVAYLKSRGQPMRARMFRDDLEHVVNEIENSETMWLGIKQNVHGYDEIDVDDKVSVRSEVARLTRLYEAAVKKYMQNNPDMYTAGGGLLDPITGLRARPGAGGPVPAATTTPDAANASSAPDPSPASSAPVGDGDESPATAKDPRKTDQKADGTAITDDQAKDTSADQVPQQSDGAAGTMKPNDDAEDDPADKAPQKKADGTAGPAKTDGDNVKDKPADQAPNTNDHGTDVEAGVTALK